LLVSGFVGLLMLDDADACVGFFCFGLSIIFFENTVCYFYILWLRIAQRIRVVRSFVSMRTLRYYYEWIPPGEFLTTVLD